MFKFKPKPEPETDADKQHLKKLEKFAEELIVKMRADELSYHEALIILLGTIVGLSHNAIQEGIMTKDEMVKWFEDAAWNARKMVSSV